MEKEKSEYLRILRPLQKGEGRKVKCKCILCGGYNYTDIDHVMKGNVKSCGCLTRIKPPPKDKTGMVINNAILIGYERAGLARFYHPGCGHTSSSYEYPVRTRSDAWMCSGCARRELSVYHNTSHGRSKNDRTYNSWLTMRRRCDSPLNNRYNLYGARGITVCDRWQDSFENFLNDMGERPEGTSIERIDGSKGYYPENCKWADLYEQAYNRVNTWKVNLGGEWLSLRSASKKKGLDYKNVHHRVKTKGEPLESIFGDDLLDYIRPTNR